MAHSITLGEVAQRTDMIEIRCRRCERHGRLNVARLLAEPGPYRCDPYCLDLVRLFRSSETQAAQA
jgi:hypothetical protein